MVMLNPVHGIAALVLSACAASAVSAQQPVQFASTIGAAATAQYGGAWQPGPGWDRDIDVRCASANFTYNMCQVDTGTGGAVRISRQISKTRCIEGRNWGWNRAGVWVDQGCEAVFRVQRRWAGGRPGPGPGAGQGQGQGGWHPGAGWDAAISVHCASQDFRYNMCQVDTGRGSSVRIARQISKTRCTEGRNWGWNRAGIWVDQGCEAEFRVDRRWR
jgi:hypothetical protein